MDKILRPSRFQRGIIKSLGIEKYLTERERDKHTNTNINSNEDETYRLMENRVWNEADPSKLEFFYKTNHNQHLYKGFQFWRSVNTNIPRVHYPMASTISSAFSSLLFSERPSFTIDSGDSNQDKKYGERLEKILDVNDMLSLLQSGAMLQSYSGAVGLKLNVDTTLSDVPLISIYPKEDIKSYKRYGQTIYVDFTDHYDDEYELVSRYGLGYINYKLYKGNRLVNLDSIPETQGLQDVAFMDKDGQLLPVMFAIVVQNEADEKSDFDGLISLFHALDEVYSSMVDYVRKTKPNVFITEDLAPKDSRGNALPFNQFDNIITILDKGGIDDQTRIERDVIELKIQGYKDAFEIIRETILTKVSLSPGTLGLPSGGANESSISLNIRERASARARSEKLAIWYEKLNSFLYASLVLDSIITKAQITGEEGIYQVEQVEEFVVRASFGAYVEETIDDKLDRNIKALQEKMCSIGYAIVNTYGDELSDVGLMFLIIETKKENGVELNEEELEFLNKQKGEEESNRFSVLNFRK